MSRTIDMLPAEAAEIRAILASHLPGCARVWAFGSRTRGRARRGSDLDLLVDLGEPLPFSLEVRLRDAFDESDIPFKVDIVDRQAASVDFLRRIEPDLAPLALDPPR